MVKTWRAHEKQSSGYAAGMQRAYKEAGRLLADAVGEEDPALLRAALQRAYREIERRAGYDPDDTDD